MSKYIYYDSPCHCVSRGKWQKGFSWMLIDGLQNICFELRKMPFQVVRVLLSQIGFWSFKASRSLGRDEAPNPMSRFYRRSADCVCRCAQSLWLHLRDRRFPVQTREWASAARSCRSTERAERKVQRLHNGAVSWCEEPNKRA